MAKVLIIGGLVVTATGVLLLLFPGLFSWFGRLPGDIRYEKGPASVSFPITTMIVVSVVLTVLLNLFFRR